MLRKIKDADAEPGAALPLAAEGQKSGPLSEAEVAALRALIQAAHESNSVEAPEVGRVVLEDTTRPAFALMNAAPEAVERLLAERAELIYREKIFRRALNQIKDSEDGDYMYAFDTADTALKQTEED